MRIREGNNYEKQKICHSITCSSTRNRNNHSKRRTCKRWRRKRNHQSRSIRNTTCRDPWRSKTNPRKRRMGSGSYRIWWLCTAKPCSREWWFRCKLFPAYSVSWQLQWRAGNTSCKCWRNPLRAIRNLSGNKESTGWSGRWRYHCSSEWYHKRSKSTSSSPG